MRPRFLRPWAAACALVLATCPLVPGPSRAAPARGPLEGKALPPADEVRSGFESLAGSLLGGELKGQVTRVVVDEDAPRRLVVRVSHEGLQGARLWGELLTSDRRRQTGIVMGEPASIPEGSGELLLTFESEPGAAPSPSALLRVSVAATGRRTAGYTRLFRLGKEWSKAAPSGEGFVVTVSPLPIGRTAELGPTPSMVVPASHVRIAPAPTTPAPAPMSGSTVRTMSPTTPTTRTRSVLTGASAPAGSSTGGAARVLPTTLMVQAQKISVGLTPADASRGARGPGALPLPTFADVRTEDIRLDLTRVLNVRPEVYQDQEPSSGIFYFLPHAYALKWDEAEGYGLKTVYSAASPGAAGEVLMAARLDGGIGSRDLELAARLVQSYAQARGMTFRELRPMPIDSLTISISDDLGRYNVPADRIAVNGLSDVAGRLDVSWVTDERTKDFIQEALIENVGINGSVTYAPTGSHLGPRTVPIHLRLADYATFGPFGWDRTGWRNPTPYPVTLRYLHALRHAAGGPPVVYSWSLRETRVPPGGQVRWSAASVPFWIDAEAQKIWIDYTVDASCKECGANAIAALTGGVSSAGSSQITFHSMTPLSESGAQRILVEVRSRYFDPQGEQTRMRSFVLDADDKDFGVGPFFGSDHLTSGAGPLFEFRLSLTMPDGEVVAGNAAWVPGDKLWMPIGNRQLVQSLGRLPGR